MATRSAVSDARPQLSVFDRLLDDQPRAPHEVQPNRFQAIRQYKESVGRDLESLLNSRSNPWDPGAEFPELRSSSFSYGLPDFSTLSVTAPAHRQQLIKRIQRAIQLHEPRLGSVEVNIPKDNESDKLQLRFIVTAMLMMDPAPEPVAFDTVLELSRGEYSVKGD